MGAQLSKGGVAVEGKAAAADPAAAKANGQVSEVRPDTVEHQRGATWHPTPTGSMGGTAGLRLGGARLLLFNPPQIHPVLLAPMNEIITGC